VRPFTLALLGDPVVNVFVGHAREPLMELVDKLKKPDGSEWQKKATAANAVGFAANVFARVGTLLKKEPPLRLAVGSLLQFAVGVDHVVDKDFAVAAQKAAAGGQVETAAFARDGSTCRPPPSTRSLRRSTRSSKARTLTRPTPHQSTWSF